MSSTTSHDAAAPAATTEHTEAAHGEGGLPQFDLAQWPGQIAWFLIIFAVVYLLMRYVLVPRISNAIDGRDSKIDGDIAEARRLKAEADAAAEAAAAELTQARVAAQKLAVDARAKAQAEIAARLAEEEAKVAGTTAEAESRITAARDAAMANVATITPDVALSIVERLTGKAATAAELGAAGRA